MIFSHFHVHAQTFQFVSHTIQEPCQADAKNTGSYLQAFTVCRSMTIVMTHSCFVIRLMD